jgi:hypothetical protein
LTIISASLYTTFQHVSHQGAVKAARDSNLIVIDKLKVELDDILKSIENCNQKDEEYTNRIFKQQLLLFLLSFDLKLKLIDYQEIWMIFNPFGSGVLKAHGA